MQPWVSGHLCFNRFHICEFETEDLMITHRENNLTKNTLELRNKPEYNELRKAMLKNDLNNKYVKSICGTCIKFKHYNLNNGYPVANQNLNDYYNEYVTNNTNNDGSLKDVNLPILYIHLSFSSTCNKECLFCSPFRSTKIAKRTKIGNDSFYKGLKKKYPIVNFNNFFKITEKNIDENFEIIKNSKIIHASVTGEPLLTKDFQNVLLRLINEKRTDKTILLNTNLATRYFNGNDWVEIFNKFDKTVLLVSMQGLDPENSIIMDTSLSYKSAYNTLLLAKEFKENLNNLTLNLHLSLNVFNYYNIINYHSTAVNMGIINFDDIIFDYVFNDPISLKYIPYRIRESNIATILNYVDNNKSKSVRGNYFNDTFIHTFTNYTELLKKFEDLSKTLKLKPYLENVNKLKNIDVFNELPHLKQLI